MVIAASAEIVATAETEAIVATAEIAETEAIAASVRRSLRPSPQRKLRLPIRRQLQRERQSALDVPDNQRSTCPAPTG